MNLFRRSLEIIQKDGVIKFLDSTREFISYKYREPIYHILYSFGSERVCPVCSWKGNKFYPHGPNRRPDARCPRCNTKERHRLLYTFLDNKDMIQSNGDLLHFAPVKHLENKLRKSSKVTTTDLLMNDMDVKSDITDLPFKNGSFDGIICSHVLEHVSYDNKAIKELYRVLRPNSWALILVPQNRKLQSTYEPSSVSSQKSRKEIFGHPDHVRWYSNDIVNTLSECGFDVSIIDYAEEIDDTEVKKYSLKESEECFFDSSIIFYCKK